MKKNKRFSRIIAMLMAAVTVFLLLPLTVSAAGCNHVYGGTMWCEPTHPHEYFYYCENGCGEKLHLGDYATKSNCSICNSALTNCAHNTQWQDPMHPHEIVCQDCCMSLGTSSMYGCAECCPYHSGYTFYENQHQPGGYHNRYLYCYNCGSTIYQGVTYFLESCEICNPPVVSNVKLYASGDSASLSSSGIIEATKVPASFSVYAECENCYVTSLYYYNNGRKISTTGNSISYTATSYDEFQSLTFYVTTNTGVTDSISVNFNYARYVEAAVKWDYDGIIVRTITQNGQTVQSGLCTALDMDWNSSLTDSDYATISELVGAYDGKIYILTGSTLVRVYKPATGETLATFDTYDEFDALCNYVSWSSQTLSAFESARVNSLSYQAPRAVEGVAQWVTTDGTVLHTQTAAEASGYEFIKPSQSITVAYSASTYTPNGYTFKEMSWECGSDTGSSTSASSYSKTYTITTPPVNVTFVYQKTPTSGSLVVCAYDEDTLALISSATISCGGDLSTSNPASFSNLPFGTYYPSASASGYKSASGMITLSATNANREIDLFLSKNAGDVTVYVYDSETGWPISGAWISGAGTGSTNASGYGAFHNEAHHPHVHLLLYSRDEAHPGFIKKTGIDKIRRAMGTTIFADEIHLLYDEQTERRNALNSKSIDEFNELCMMIEHGLGTNPKIVKMVTELSDRLKTVKGKKQYGYFPKSVKAMVDGIVDELEEDERIKRLYDLWYECKCLIYHTYTDVPPKRLPLSQENAFKPIRNAVIKRAAELSLGLADDEPIPQDNTQSSNNSSNTTLGASSAGNTSSTTTSANHNAQSHTEYRSQILTKVARLGKDIADTFRDRYQEMVDNPAITVDSKLKREIEAKKKGQRFTM